MARSPGAAGAGAGRRVRPLAGACEPSGGVVPSRCLGCRQVWAGDHKGRPYDGHEFKVLRICRDQRRRGRAEESAPCNGTKCGCVARSPGAVGAGAGRRGTSRLAALSRPVVWAAGLSGTGDHKGRPYERRLRRHSVDLANDPRLSSPAGKMLATISVAPASKKVSNCASTSFSLPTTAMSPGRSTPCASS